MGSRMPAVVFEAVDPARVAQFWAAMLGRETVGDHRGVLLPGSESQIALRFAAERGPRVGANLIHLHLTSDSADDQRRSVAKARSLGAQHLDVGQLPDEGHVVLADPEGNEFCVIEPGNTFLAGCGYLGELACEGTRAVGRFWSQALGWPLVWDQDEETAVQSPPGGTKIAWGGHPGTSRGGRPRQRLEISPDLGGGLREEVERLVALGARLLPTSEPGAALLADPDGNEFSLGPG